MKTLKAVLTFLSKLPVISFVVSYWILLISFFLAAQLSENEYLFKKYGTITFVPMFVIGAVVLSKWIGHCIFRETIDRDIREGTFLLDWKLATPGTRITLAVVIMVGFYVGACIVTGGIAK